MKTLGSLYINNEMAAAEVAAIEGTFIDSRHYDPDRLVKDDCTVYKPNGEVLFMLLRNVVALDECRVALYNLRGIGNPLSATNRTVAIGPGSGDERSRETFIHAMNRMGGRTPYCRLSQFNINQPRRFKAVRPFIQSVDRAFQIYMPERHEAQMARVRATVKNWVITGTAFSTVTVNTNVRTRVHTDKGDLPEGFGVISILESALFCGGELIFPRYKVAVLMGMGDVLLADVHELHGNGPVLPITGDHARVACVLYYRTGLQKCGTPEEEREHVNTK
jgi:hypothetical protein